MNLPNFIVIGASKAGTTSLYHYLAQHPDIYMSPVKEPGFFAWHGTAIAELDAPERAEHAFPIRSMDDYQELFSLRANERAIGEASVIYLAATGTAERIRAVIPESKLIVSLRNPVDRAYSIFRMYVRNRGTDLTFEEAIESDRRWWTEGLQGAGLRSYYEAFGSDQIRPIVFEQWRRDRYAAVADLYRWLDVDPSFEPDLSMVHNAGSMPRNRLVGRAIRSRAARRLATTAPTQVRDMLRRAKQPLLQEAEGLTDDLRSRLSGHFAEDIELLETLTGLPLTRLWQPTGNGRV